jgi:hypothetical protein
VPSERCSVEDQSIEYCGLACYVVRFTHHVTKYNMPIYNIVPTAAQLSISHKALGTLPEDGNVIAKHVGATIHN